MSHPASPFPSGDRFYETIVRSLGGIVWAADPDTFQFTFVSEQAERVLGYPVREWLDDPAFWRRHTHPDDVARCTAFCQDATRQGRNHTFEYRMIGADGRTVWLRDIVTVQREGAETRLVGIMLDISAQKAEEEAQGETAALYRFLAENTSDVITLQDLDGRIVYASPSHARMFGYTSETGFEVLHPDDLDAAKRAWDRVVRGEAPLSVTYRFLHPNGSWLWAESMGRLVDYRGQPHVLAITRDLTDRRRLEDQLRQAQKMEAIGLLAGGVAHDFNNLLTVILGYAELLADLVREPRTHAVVEEIRHACDRAVLLTQQLLAFSRKQVLHPTVVDLDEVIRDVVTMLSRIIGESIEVTVTTAGTAPRVLADVVQVHQVVTNLAVNARDAMPMGGHLTIETSALRTPPGGPPELSPGHYAVVSISDTGSGIEPHVLPRIFEPFFTTKELGKGTGLGLSTVYGIMQQSGGHIDVRSEVGAGTTFTLYFPETTLAPSPAPPAEKTTVARGRELVLLVEDESQVRSLVERALERGGYRVRAAASGMEALEMAWTMREPIALLVTDVVMPGMSGPDLVRRLEAIWPGLRVLYISGYAGDSVLREGVSEERAGFLQKPFSTKSFLRKVRQVIEAERDASHPGGAR